MKKYIAFLFLAAVFGCQFTPSATWIDDHIDPAVRTEMAPLNKKLAGAFYAKDAKTIKQMMSKTLLDSSGKTIDTIVDVVAHALHNNNFANVDEFYTTNARVGGAVILRNDKKTANDYTIQYKALNKTSYAVLMRSEGMVVNIAILAVYGKYDDGWKINILSASDYDILGKNAPQFYTEALKKYQKGDTIDAASNIIMAGQVFKPGGKHFAYDNEGDMKNFYTRLLAEANATYHFPITVKQIKTQPQIFDISPQLISSDNDKGFYPMIKYKSNVDLSDTVALKTENLALQKVIGNLFKGITQDKKCILYVAVDRMPDGKTPIKQHRFEQKLK